MPANAVIDSGTRKIVLVAKGKDRFEPREVSIGRIGSGFIEVIDSLEEGEEVVTSATFLIDAESKLKAELKAVNDAATLQ